MNAALPFPTPQPAAVGCRLCPRACGTDRTTAHGFCGANDTMEVATVCVHRGEEPPLNPIVNVFFAHCNLQCIYCQNWQISHPSSLRPPSGLPPTSLPLSSDSEVQSLADQIGTLLPAQGGLLGLVTAAHYADRIPSLVAEVRRRGLNPTVVYNSSGYESVKTLRLLEGVVDVYLPDLKYMDSRLAEAYSHAPDYPAVAAAALVEMRRQVGNGLAINEATGQAERGIIVRHLVLPGATSNSHACLDWLADHFNPFSLHLSLMAQYYPAVADLPAPLDRGITEDEYATVTDYATRLGFCHGWTQPLEAADNYRPDFAEKENPFGNARTEDSRL